ncbi:MAG: hypothetical protein LWW86_07570 [Micrococcales bacterium]|nr:hypothetical protein [Micrococcales bacterium]
MFDLIGGLPMHPLVLHAFVVLGPLAALLAIAYAARPAWRAGLKWPTAALAVVAGLSGFLTKETGEFLERRLKAQGEDAAGMAAIHDHAEAGDLAFAAGALLMVLTLVAVFWLVRAGREPRFGGAGNLLAIALLTLSGLFTIGAVLNAGHTGAKAVWGDQVDTSVTVPGEGGG